MKHAVKTVSRTALTLALLGLGVGAWAQEANPVLIHGFGGWAAAHTNNDNTYGDIASNDWEQNNYYFALNVAAVPAKDWSIHTQTFLRENLAGRAVELDYAFVQWTPSPALAVRAGRIKNPAGLLSEIYDVGTLRPFYLLPQGRYGGAAKAYLGAGLTAEHSFGSWDVRLDLYGGQLAMQPLAYDIVVGANPETGAPILHSVTLQPVGRDLIAGGVSVSPPIEGLEIGASYVRNNVESHVVGTTEPTGPPSESKTTYVNAEYLKGGVSVRAEAFWVEGATEINAGYVEGAYKLTKNWQIAASYGWRDLTASPTPLPDDRLGDHAAIGAALNFWASPGVVFKLNYYRVKDNAFARPASAIESALAGTLEDSTNVVIVGTQFSF